MKELFSNFNIVCRLQIPIEFECEAITLPGHMRHNLFLAVKETLNNVIRHASATEVPLTMTYVKEHLEIIIADSGCGFEENKIRRSHDLTNLDDRLTALHGDCEIKSQSSQGTVVKFYVPLPPPLRNSRKPSSNLMTTVAIIEDNHTMRKMLTEVIDSAPNYRCLCTCSTSKEDLIEVPKNWPDVALIDIHLPDESGIVCTARLTEKMPDLQVIIVTVCKDTELIFQVLKAGAWGYILKRFRPDQILQAIAESRAGGAPMTSEIARMVVRSFRAPSKMPNVDELTASESELLGMLADGLSNKEIAQKANIAAGTVRIHLEHIFKKLHVRCRTEAAAKYFGKK